MARLRRSRHAIFALFCESQSDPAGAQKKCASLKILVD
jgi:hypothetical protein